MAGDAGLAIEIRAAWRPDQLARVALFDQDADQFISDAALFMAASLVLAGEPTDAARVGRVEVWAAARDQLTRLRAAGAGRAGRA